MTTGYWLRTATNFLQSKGIATARLDALVLLEDALKVNRAQLLAEPETPMRDGQVEYLKSLLIRRGSHLPLAYIRGWAEFYGRNFIITPDVLVPRPESETIIELLKTLNSNQKIVPNARIADVGAGSGALGITAHLEMPKTKIDLLEIDHKAAAVAQNNVDLFTPSVTVIMSDLLQKTIADYNVLLCNLPYVPDDYPINKAARHEPKLALFAGVDGLSIYRRLFTQLAERSTKPLYVLTEALPEQHHALARYARQHGYLQAQKQDFIQVFERFN